MRKPRSSFVGWVSWRLRKAQSAGVTHHFSFRGDKQWWITPCELRFAQSQG